MRRLLLALSVGLVPPLLACSGLVDPEALEAMAQPVPPPAPAWAGTWEGPGMRVVIAPDGYVEIDADATGTVSTATSVKAPAQSWADGKIVVGIGMFTTSWTVNEAPYERDGEWRMVVEGVVLVRTTAAEAPTPAVEDGAPAGLPEPEPVPAPEPEGAPTPGE